jgi:multiple sugar transport system ATP-binding protein
MAEITLESLTKVYSDGTQAVTDLQLEVAAGEFVVFVGPSGCGKTTALRMIAGRIVNDLPPKDRDIAMVFQNYALYPHMNAAKNMGFALKMRGLPKDEIDRRVRDAARILGLSDSLEKKPRTLSGGQRQRVAMGRAIVRNPQAFLMDEPLSNLDAKLRVEMRAEISRIQRDLGVTTIYVTHDQTEAMTMGDRVVVMRSGFLQQIASPKELYDEPRNLFVAEFIGSPAMNLVAARVERTDDGLWVSFGPHRLRLEPRTIEKHPGLDAYDDREVVLGIRPEDMEDAAVVSTPNQHRRMSVVCDIREDLGSEVYAHFRVAAGAVTTREVVEALVVEDAGDEEARMAAEHARGEGVTFVARLERASGAREREPLEIAVDVTRLHFFDPGTGLRIDAARP